MLAGVLRPFGPIGGGHTVMERVLKVLGTQRSCLLQLSEDRQFSQGREAPGMGESEGDPQLGFLRPSEGK